MQIVTIHHTTTIMDTTKKQPTSTEPVFILMGLTDDQKLALSLILTHNLTEPRIRDILYVIKSFIDDSHYEIIRNKVLEPLMDDIITAWQQNFKNYVNRLTFTDITSNCNYIKCDFMMAIWIQVCFIIQRIFGDHALNPASPKKMKDYSMPETAADRVHTLIMQKYREALI
jgi:hypothetical protein